MPVSPSPFYELLWPFSERMGCVISEGLVHEREVCKRWQKLHWRSLNVNCGISPTWGWYILCSHTLPEVMKGDNLWILPGGYNLNLSRKIFCSLVNFMVFKGFAHIQCSIHTSQWPGPRKDHVGNIVNRTSVEKTWVHNEWSVFIH